MPFDGDLLLLSNTQQEFDTQSINFNMSPNEYVFSPVPLSTNSNSSVEFLFPNETLFVSNELPSEITMDDIKIFQKTHDDYCAKLYQALLKFQYDFIEKLIEQFWSLTNIHSSSSNDLIHAGNVRLKTKLANQAKSFINFRFNDHLEIQSYLYITFYSRSISSILFQILSNNDRQLLSRHSHTNNHRMFPSSLQCSLAITPTHRNQFGL